MCSEGAHGKVYLLYEVLRLPWSFFIVLKKQENRFHHLLYQLLKMLMKSHIEHKVSDQSTIKRVWERTDHWFSVSVSKKRKETTREQTKDERNS